MEVEMADGQELSKEFGDLYELSSLRLLDRGKQKQLATLRGGKISLQLAKWVIKLFVKVCETNLYQEESFRELGPEKRHAILKSHQKKPHWWQLAHRTIVIYLILKQIFLVILEYGFDILIIQYKRHKNTTIAPAPSAAAATPMVNETLIDHFGGNNSSDRNPQAETLERYIAQYKAVLKITGAPFIKMTLICECMQVFIICNAIAFYAITLFYYKFVGPLNISLMRMLADEKREQRNINVMILEEIDKVIQSSKYHLVRTLNDYSCLPDFAGNNNRNIDFLAIEQTMGQNSKASTLFQYHKSIVRLVKRLALDGSLQPPNRKPFWLTEMAITYVVFYVVFSLIGATSTIIFIVIGPLYMGANLGTSFMDSENLLELITLSIFTIIVLGLGVSQLICVFADQWYAVHKLRKNIDQCISTNSFLELVANSESGVNLGEKIGHNHNHNHHQHHRHRHQQRQQYCLQSAPLFALNSAPGTHYIRSYECHHVTNDSLKLPNNVHHTLDCVQTKKAAEILAESSHSRIGQIEQMNENLLRVLMQYRILVHQCQPLKHPFSFVPIFMTNLYVIYPFYALIHAPYLSRVSCITLTCTFWVFLLCYDCTSLPVCSYHAKCRHLYRDLHRLLAHVDKLQALSLGGFSTYNWHIVTMLRRETNDPGRNIERMAIMVLGSPFSYKHLIKMHFWAGILSLYALFVDESTASRGSSILGAPGQSSGEESAHE